MATLARRAVPTRLPALLALLLLTLATLNLAVIKSSATDDEGQEHVKYKVESLWTWTGSSKGNIVDLAVDVDRDVVYALLIGDKNVVAVYEFNLKTGALVNATRLNLRAIYGHLTLTPATLSAVLIGEKNNVSIITINPGSLSYKLTGSLSVNDSRVRVVDAASIGGHVVVAGAKASLNGSLECYIAAYDGGRKLWEDAWSTHSNGYFITIKPVGVGEVCAAGVGGYACYTLNGVRVLSKTINATILALEASSANSIIIAGINQSREGFIALVENGELRWERNLGPLIPQALTSYSEGLIYVAGEALFVANNTVKHNLAIALLNIKGDVKVVGIEEANGTVVVPSIATITPFTVIIGGSISAEPFVKSLHVEKSVEEQSLPQTPQTSAEASQTVNQRGIMMQYYASMALLAASITLLGLITLNLYKKRKK